MTEDGANRRWVPSIRSVAIITATVGLLLLALYFLGPYFRSEWQTTLSTPASGPSTTGQPAPSFVEGIGAIVAILTIFGGGVLFIFQHLLSQISGLTQRLNAFDSTIDQNIKAKLGTQTENVTEHYRQLKSNLDTVEERYPWLTGVKDFEGVINVPSSTALLETIGNVIASDKRSFAYEWFVEAAEDNKLRGTPESFLALAVIARVLFGDDLLVDKMLRKCEEAASGNIIWRAARLAHYVRIGNLAAAASVCLELEHRVLKRRLPDLIQVLLGRRTRLPEAIPPEVLATLSLFYEQAGDRYGLNRVLPAARKRVPKQTLDRATEIARLINPNGPRAANEESGLAQSSFITILLKIEVDITNQLSDLASDPAAIYAHVERLYALTGNRQVAKAMQRVLRRVVEDREELIAFKCSVSSALPTETTAAPSPGSVLSQSVQERSLRTEFNLAKKSPPETAVIADERNGNGEVLAFSDFDPVWNGQWKPDHDDPMAVGGYPPERAQSEARERATKLRAEEKKNRSRVKEALRLKEAAEAKRRATALNVGPRETTSEAVVVNASEDVTSPDQPAMRVLDVLDVPWETIAHESSMYAFVESKSPIDRINTVSADSTQAEHAALPWAKSISMIRLSDVSWRPENLRVYYLYVNDGEHSGNDFRLMGNAGPIYEINKVCNVAIEERFAAQYLRFFCFFARAESGPFHTLESEVDFLIPRDLGANWNSKLRNAIRPIDVLGRSESGGYYLEATILYEDEIFEVVFEVSPNGQVEILDYRPIVRGLPFRVEVPLKADADRETDPRQPGGRK